MAVSAVTVLMRSWNGMLSPEVGERDPVLGGLVERLLLQGVSEGLHGGGGRGGDIDRGSVA